MAPGSPLLGIDVGTQSVRAAIVDEAGHTLAFGLSPVETVYPRPGWAEQDPAQWWRAACEAVARALESAGITGDAIAGIGLDSTSCTVVACDIEGRALRPALLWMDQRASSEAAAIDATGDPALRYVSGRMSPEWMLPKALWLKSHEPEIYAKSGRIVECTNWLMHRLTGEWTLSLNHCAVKWNYVRPEGGWPLGLLRAAGIDDLIEKWPREIVPLGGGNGRLASHAAAELGLRTGTTVAQGGIDAYLGMVGLGATGAGDVAIITGSSTCLLAQSKRGIFGSGWAGCYPDATVEGMYTMEAGLTATGSILAWYAEHFAGDQKAQARDSGLSTYAVLDKLAAQVASGADGVLVREDWQGNRSPHKNPHARGAITGLTLAHGPGHLIRAIYEATALGTRHILEDGERHGMAIGRVVAGGGGVRSDLWMQIHADALQRPIVLTRDPESCALGSAMLGACAAGVYPSLDEAGAAMVGVTRVIEPRAELAGIYSELSERSRRLYRALNPAPGV
jgi:FGGY-family pentulose kinase